MRVVRIGPRFTKSQRFHAPSASPERSAVVRIVRELGNGELPGPDDQAVLIPPVLRCMGRPIPSAGLLVCYRVDADGTVELVAVKRAE